MDTNLEIIIKAFIAFAVNAFLVTIAIHHIQKKYKFQKWNQTRRFWFQFMVMILLIELVSVSFTILINLERILYENSCCK